MSNYLSIVEWVSSMDDEPHNCGYCKGESSISDGIWGHIVSPEDYQRLIDRGWRRSGKYIYKPEMDKTCCPQFTIKCDAENHRISRSQKRSIWMVQNYLNNGKKSSSVDICQSKSISIPEEDVLAPKELSAGSLVKVSSQPESLPKRKSSDGEIRKSSDEEIFRRGNLPKRKSSAEETFRSVNLSKHELKTASELEGSQKARHKRQLRRLSKGKPVVKGMLRDPPKLIEERLKDQLNFSQHSDFQFTLQGDKLKLQIELVYIDSPRDLETRPESHQVYKKYQVKVHDDKPDDITTSKWIRFLLDNPFREDRNKSEKEPKQGLYHCHYRLDGQLVAVGVLDFLSACISSVYLYYDPAYEFLNLGTYSALVEIFICRSFKYQWYYMGYYIQSCKKMRYKKSFRPSYLSCPKSFEWMLITKHICDLLDENPHSRLSAENMKDQQSFILPRDELLSGLGPRILHMRMALEWEGYLGIKETIPPDELEIVQRYCTLLGRNLSSSMCLYR